MPSRTAPHIEMPSTMDYVHCATKKCLVGTANPLTPVVHSAPGSDIPFA